MLRTCAIFLTRFLLELMLKERYEDDSLLSKQKPSQGAMKSRSSNPRMTLESFSPISLKLKTKNLGFIFRFSLKLQLQI